MYFSGIIACIYYNNEVQINIWAGYLMFFTVMSYMGQNAPWGRFAPQRGPFAPGVGQKAPFHEKNKSLKKFL